MDELKMTAEELLGGAGMTYDVVIPGSVLYPGGDGKAENVTTREKVVQLRPLTIGALQLIMKAAKNEMGLVPLLMIKESMVKPTLSLEQVKQLHLGLVNFLIGHIRELSGLTEKKSP